MDLLLIIGIVVLVVVILFLLVFWGYYNRIIRLENRIDNSWAQIDVQLKRRHDLIPNLVETAKGYMKHERDTLENITKARNQAAGASGVGDQIKAENNLNRAMGSFYVVVENYPDLKANQNAMQLQEEIVNTENKLAFAKQAYNDSVTKYNYTKTGLLYQTIKPDKIILTNHYDNLGRKISLTSSDNKINYYYSYNQLDQLVESKDISKKQSPIGRSWFQ